MSLEVSKKRLEQLGIPFPNQINIQTVDQIASESIQSKIQQLKQDLVTLDLANEETFQMQCMQQHSITKDLRRNIANKLQTLDQQTDEAINNQIKQRLSVQNQQ